MNSTPNPGTDSARWRAGMVIVVTLMAGFAIGAAADEDSGSPGSMIDKEFVIALGGFFPRIESTVSVAPTSGIGSGQEISLEDALGLDDDNSSAWIGGAWKFLPRHQLQAEWFQLNRAGQNTAGTAFTIEDMTVGVGAATSSKVDFNLGRLTYGYSFYKTDDVKGNFLVGMHIATFKGTFTASGAVTVNGAPAAGGSYSVSTSTYTVPLPHLGGSVVYNFAPRWTTQFTLLGFALQVDEYSGYLIEADATVAYQLSKHFGIGGGLKYFNLNFQAESTSAAAEFDYQFYGPAIFGLVTF